GKVLQPGVLDIAKVDHVVDVPIRVHVAPAHHRRHDDRISDQKLGDSRIEHNVFHAQASPPRERTRGRMSLNTYRSKTNTIHNPWKGPLYRTRLPLLTNRQPLITDRSLL